MKHTYTYELELIELDGMEPFVFIRRTGSDGTTAGIPQDPNNSDYKTYLEDTNGGLPEPKSKKK